MDAFLIVINKNVFPRGKCIIVTYLREALTARFIPKGIPEPQFVRRAEHTDSHAFFIYLNANEGSPFVNFIKMKFFEALTVVNQKVHLIGKLRQNGAILDEIIIAPSQGEEYDNFIQTYIDSLDAQKSIAPYIQSDVVVLGVFDKSRITHENTLIISEI